LEVPSSSLFLLSQHGHFEKEADGIAARKAKQMGFAIEGIIEVHLRDSRSGKGRASGGSSLLQT